MMRSAITQHTGMLHETWSFLRPRPALLLLPLLAALWVLALCLLFAGLVAMAFAPAGGTPAGVGQLVAVLLLLAVLVAAARAGVALLNAALSMGTLRHLRGYAPAVQGHPLRRIVRIAGYGLLVGLFDVSSALFGGAEGELWIERLEPRWRRLLYLVLPMLGDCDLSLRSALGETGALLRRSWGNRLVPTINLDAIFGPLQAISGLLLLLAGLAWFSADVAAALPIMPFVVALAVAFICAIGLVRATFETVFATALYIYLTDGTVTPPFTRATLQRTFRSQAGAAVHAGA